MSAVLRPTVSTSPWRPALLALGAVLLVLGGHHGEGAGEERATATRSAAVIALPCIVTPATTPSPIHVGTARTSTGRPSVPSHAEPTRAHRAAERIIVGATYRGHVTMTYARRVR